MTQALSQSTAPVPFYSGRSPIVGFEGVYQLDYFKSRADAERFADLFGGWVIETSAGQIWRVTRN